MTLPAQDILPDECMLCPRLCGAHRRAGERGACGAADELRLARAALHEWEEPPISVGAGSGAVFFSNCALRCIYCQNVDIACGAHGTDVLPERLAQIFQELAAQGAANINLVTPTHYLPFIVRSITDARDAGMDLPVVYNTSGYERAETMRSLKGIVDVFLTDFKYWRDGESDAARRYSHAPDYFQTAAEALDAMVQIAGEPTYDIFGKEDDACGRGERLTHGVVIRHLILPGRLDDSKRIVEYLWQRYGTGVLYSVMNQYTPLRAFAEAPELDAKVSDEEYDQLLDFMDELGMSEYFWQQGGAAQESFIPAFDSTGIEREL